MQADVTNANVAEFAAKCQALLTDIKAALGLSYFTKGHDVEFVELVPDGWEGRPTAMISYGATHFFRDTATGSVIAARKGGDGTSYAILKPGMGEAALPWEWGSLVSMN